MLITLTSDFGHKDPFVGIMKGTILNINPPARIMDITHGITPHDVSEAALVIAESYSYFPPKTIHVVVVDPEVGSGRRPILAVTDDYIFIGPDNGVFTAVFASQKETLDVRCITAEHYFLPKRGSTFHGRDVFAPVAAWLSRGVSVSNMGESITDYVTIDLPSSARTGGVIEGSVVFVDHFGNAMTNIRQEDIDSLISSNPSGRLDISLSGNQATLRTHYLEGREKELSGVINSYGRLEFFLYKASAAKAIGIGVGDPVTVRLV